jgi:hypothetical protein
VTGGQEKNLKRGGSLLGTRPKKFVLKYAIFTPLTKADDFSDKRENTLF